MRACGISLRWNLRVYPAFRFFPPSFFPFFLFFSLFFALILLPFSRSRYARPIHVSRNWINRERLVPVRIYPGAVRTAVPFDSSADRSVDGTASRAALFPFFDSGLEERSAGEKKQWALRDNR